MKNIIPIIAVLAFTATVNAQQTTADGAAVGAVAGALIGANNHAPVAGAVAGAIVGGVIGNAIEQNQQKPVIVQTPAPPVGAAVVCTPVPPGAPVVVEFISTGNPFIQYGYGPINQLGYPEYVFVYQWNGVMWVSTYYPYNAFVNWYVGFWHRPLRLGHESEHFYNHQEIKHRNPREREHR